MKLICDDRRGLRIGGKSLAQGDKFEISDREGGLLVMLGKAKPDELGGKESPKQEAPSQESQPSSSDKEHAKDKKGGILGMFKK